MVPLCFSEINKKLIKKSFLEIFRQRFEFLIAANCCDTSRSLQVVLTIFSYFHPEIESSSMWFLSTCYDRLILAIYTPLAKIIFSLKLAKIGNFGQTNWDRSHSTFYDRYFRKLYLTCSGLISFKISSRPGVMPNNKNKKKSNFV